jgi:hypothetical protein
MEPLLMVTHVAFCVPTHLFFFFLFLYHSTTHIKMLFGNMIAGEVHPQPHISAFGKEKK